MTETKEHINSFSKIHSVFLEIKNKEKTFSPVDVGRLNFDFFGSEYKLHPNWYHAYLEALHLAGKDGVAPFDYENIGNMINALAPQAVTKHLVNSG